MRTLDDRLNLCLRRARLHLNDHGKPSVAASSAPIVYGQAISSPSLEQLRTDSSFDACVAGA